MRERSGDTMTAAADAPTGGADSGYGLAASLREAIQYVPSGDSMPEASWAGRHRNILVLLVAHVPPLLLLGLYSGTESTFSGASIPALPLAHVLVGVGLLVGFAALASVPRFGRRVRTSFATLGLVSASAVLVYFSGGYIEAHFHFFVVMAVVAVYEDWFPYLLGIVYVAVQHGVFGMTYPEMVYNHAAAIANPMAWAGIHATFVLGLSAALVAHWYSTERSREEAASQLRESERKTAEMESLAEKNAQIEAAKAKVEGLNEQLQADAEAYSAAMARAADGQLGVRLDAGGDNEAMVQIAEAFNEMMAETESAMQDIQAFARDVAAASEEATAATVEAEGASESVSESIREIARGADTQRGMLEGVADEMTEMSATIQQVAASADSVARTSEATAEIAEAGDETAQAAIGASRDVQDAIDATVENVEALDDRMVEIGEIVELIGDIAEQTNLLALNANIEAARASAGEGHGFGVVADEVKSLADEAKAAAAEVEALIEDAQDQTTLTAEEARAAQADVESSVEAVQEVVEAFSRVAGNTEETARGVQEISDATDDQAESTEEAVSMVDEVAEISRRTAQEVDTVSAAAEQQTSSTSQVSASVESLAARAERLQTLLSKFEVGDEPSHDPASGGTPPADVVLGDGGESE